MTEIRNVAADLARFKRRVIVIGLSCCSRSAC
jgi:hypothetical protein